MKSVEGRSEGDRVSIMFRDGVLDCVVKEVRKDGKQ